MSGRHQEHPRFGHRLLNSDGDPTWHSIASDMYARVVALSGTKAMFWPSHTCAFRCAMRGYKDAAAEAILNLPEADKEAIKAAFAVGGATAAQELFDALTWPP